MHKPLFMASKEGHKNHAMLDNRQVKWRDPCWIKLAQHYCNPEYCYNREAMEKAKLVGETRETMIEPNYPTLPNMAAWDKDLETLKKETVLLANKQLFVDAINKADPMDLTMAYAVRASCKDESEYKATLA
ncbi:hypothetical protein SARC_09486 [Sphaeroforma arctica JP610]|uniref:Uncharacterized protein n=1 Tax=Sphaeroforma arctica JP610 TaxID=667725 RepID=A0A0L0FMT8_9EUKA|nr:hypothetical protein SARC_09486 [Sphaeroforma arctica JP610]KNC78065.1 hypothetical protein SARC_09486 [Sphaeroforma arctica JP610]|eukprot:XP_014151967.1 hypothetical protein SARC_09486 [Sphaeroforma arctica JP610]